MVFASISSVFIACSSGSALPVPASKNLSSLTSTEASSLCSWEQSELVNTTCNGKKVTGFCVAGTPSFAACGAKTVGDFQQCTNANRGCDAIGALEHCFPLICVKTASPPKDGGGATGGDN